MSFKKGDRVKFVPKNYNPNNTIPFGAIGTIFSLPQNHNDCIVKFDMPYAVPNNTPTQVWFIPVEHLQKINDETLPPGYKKTPSGFLTNPDNWLPGKRLF